MALTPVEEVFRECGWTRLEGTSIWSLQVMSGLGFYKNDVSLDELMRYPDPEGWIREATDRLKAQYEADAARTPRN